jgi:LacI family transcriptional regulator
MAYLRATITDVARVAGVSRSTASRVIGEYGYASESAKKRVLEAARELGYRPHAIARSMVTGRTGTIGLVVADIENPFFARCARGANDAITPEHHNLIVCSTNENVHDEIRAIDGLCQKQVDGLIISMASRDSLDHIASITAGEVPVVLIDRVADDPQAEFDAVAASNVEGAYEAVCHLISSGHKRIGFLGDSIITTSERLTGYKQALTENNMAISEPNIRIGSYSVEGGYREAVSLLSAKNPPDAVLASSNFTTIGLLMAIEDMDLVVPDEVAVVSFDDMEWCKLTSPTITAVSQPAYEMGRVAAQQLLRRISGDKSRPELTRLPTRLIVRESSVLK